MRQRIVFSLVSSPPMILEGGMILAVALAGAGFLGIVPFHLLLVTVLTCALGMRSRGGGSAVEDGDLLTGLALLAQGRVSREVALGFLERIRRSSARPDYPRALLEHWTELLDEPGTLARLAQALSGFGRFRAEGLDRVADQQGSGLLIPVIGSSVFLLEISKSAAMRASLDAPLLRTSFWCLVGLWTLSWFVRGAILQRVATAVEKADALVDSAIHGRGVPKDLDPEQTLRNPADGAPLIHIATCRLQDEMNRSLVPRKVLRGISRIPPSLLAFLLPIATVNQTLARLLL